MSEPLVLPTVAGKLPHTWRHSASDVSQLVTTRLRRRAPPVETTEQQLAQHETEIQRLAQLAEDVEQAVTAVVIRVPMVSGERIREALQQNRAGLQRLKDDLDLVRSEHLRAIERVRERSEHVEKKG